jgi:uncharacterized protein (UPF0333 family)
MLASLRKFTRKTLKNNRGQGATEYILLVAVVVGIVMMFGPKIKQKLTDTTDQLGGKITESVDKSTSAN